MADAHLGLAGCSVRFFLQLHLQLHLQIAFVQQIAQISGGNSCMQPVAGMGLVCYVVAPRIGRRDVGRSGMWARQAGWQRGAALNMRQGCAVHRVQQGGFRRARLEGDSVRAQH